MTLLTLILAVVALTATSFIALYLVDLVRRDGYGSRRPSQPPSSHPPDAFERLGGPHRFA